MQADVLRFLIFDWLKLDLSQSNFVHLNQHLVEQLLQLSEQLALAALAPVYTSLDQLSPSSSNPGVQTAGELKNAVQALAQAGIFGTQAGLSEGGTALPNPVCVAMAGLLSAQNAPVYDYVRQTQLVASLIRQFGSPDQRQQYLPLLASGEYFGALCLNELQVGSSLGDLQCSATSVAANLFQISGEKAWVNGAEHDLCRNIVYLVLARSEGVSAEAKEPSLFVVPRWLEIAGSQKTNGVSVSHLNVFGMSAVVNADLKFGGKIPCYAELLGGELGVGMAQLQATLCERSLAAGVAAAGTAAHALAIAARVTQSRGQARALAGTDTQSEHVRIGGYAAARLKLLRVRALTDGAMLLVLYTANRMDAAKGEPTASTERNLLATLAKHSAGKIAMEVSEFTAQLSGAEGLQEPLGVQAVLRDAQALRWLEGSDEQNALEAVARFVLADHAASIVVLLNAVASTAKRAAQCPRFRGMAPTALELGAELAKIAQKWAEYRSAGDVDLALCQSSQFIETLGRIVLAWLSLDACLAAIGSSFEQRLSENCRYLHQFELESVRGQLAILSQQDIEWVWARKPYLG